MLNAISIDVEEYFHANNLWEVAPPGAWHRLESSVVGATEKLLGLLADQEVQATFFILGYVARRFPNLIRDIASEGHEIASHGYGHQLVYSLTQAQFRRDIEKSKFLLEDITGAEVCGYRAPSFSIKDSTPWAYETLVQVGFKYDSSLHPIWHPRYANLGKPRDLHHVSTDSGNLSIVPIGTSEFNLFGKQLRMPCAGGAYWRLFPSWVSSFLLSRVNSKDKIPFTCYLHPWEIDDTQHVFEELPFLTRVRHYGGIKGFQEKLNGFICKHKFGSINQVYFNKRS